MATREPMGSKASVGDPTRHERGLRAAEGAFLEEYADEIADPRADAIELALSFALLAPSPRNIQPWAFAADVDGGEIDVYLDRSRSRPVADPLDRELTISCGVALEFVRLALASLGADNVVTMYPDPSKTDHLAKIRLSGEALAPDENAQELVASATTRHTNWHQFVQSPVPRADLEALAASAEREGAHLHIATDSERPMVEYLIAKAGHLQLTDPDFVAELRRWPTGRPGTVDSSAAAVSKRAARETTAGSLVALATDGDTPEQWIVAGEGLAAVLLTAAGLGLAVAFANQPLQLPQTRADVAATFAVGTDLQQLLRVGFADVAPEQTPRRSLDDVSVPLSEPW